MDDPLPAPLVPADVDLRDFPYMPLDVERLINSDLTALATGEQFKAAVLLWCHAWHSVPAGSLHVNEDVLALHSGAGIRWRYVRKFALHGFILCSDNRYYHPVIAEKAIESFRKRKSASKKAKAAANARWMLEASHKHEPENASSNAQAMHMHEKSMLENAKGSEGKGIEGKGLREHRALPVDNSEDQPPKTRKPKTLHEENPTPETPKNGWWNTDAGIVATAKTLNLPAISGETVRDLRERCFVEIHRLKSANATPLPAIKPLSCARCGTPFANGGFTAMTGGNVCNPCYAAYLRSEWQPSQQDQPQAPTG
jgi:hypothetical protein